MSKLLPCQACCPKRPGYSVGRVRHENDYVLVSGEYGDDAAVFGWAWVCDNCGNVKKPRKSKRRDHEFVTELAETDAGMNRANVARFHFFNPNGLYAELRAVQARVAEVVDLTGVPNGVLFVHGSLNGFNADQLRKQIQKARPDRYGLPVTLRAIRRDIDQAKAWIAETLAKHGIDA